MAIAPLLPLGGAKLVGKGVDSILAKNLPQFIETSGQWHHVISGKIEKAINNMPNLKGVINRNDLIVQGSDAFSHRGYQQWHRDYDQSTVKWLRMNSNASPVDFLGYLGDIYKTPAMQNRFPDAWRLIEMTVEELFK